MNVSPGLFENPQGARIWRGAGVCLGAFILAGCASANPFAAAPVDPLSPAGEAVLAAARADKAYPRFSDIPPAPTDVRGPRAWAAAVSEVEAARADLFARTAPSTWTLDDTEGFATRAQAQAAPPPVAGAPANTEAFAREARERATPPPSPR
ncbi:hypothetical protein [Phenylobacterium sp.]|uniref:hypothetical protein n=1 Tax=Phenylobacterium sp. TaxID=1871053 RepID=UPI002731D6CE|nr:hypothetical protein [Phenylobacterium sp.]MDP1874575.1 hypothetical protein [Phenylobacterium sp.]